jgi:dihydrofolate synthase/folylpolyglutamate synthase
MNYKETLEYLFARLPMFQRIGSAAYKADLNNTIALCRMLDNPEKKFRSVHIAGTNGKGSTSHMLASILQEAGYKTALYTSPHLKDFRERIRINGEMIPRENVIEFVKKYRDEFEKIEPSFFELTVGMAFEYFAEEQVDIAVIETGLGGRLDSTNVIIPELSVITNISKDHVALLGDTIEKIAVEKAGIIKTGVAVVIGERQEGSEKVFLQKAESEHAEILFADQNYSLNDIRYNSSTLQADVFKGSKLFLKDLECGLKGIYQQKNIVTVLASMEQLQLKGFEISEKDIRSGIRKVVENTGLLGRWQRISEKPLVIADTGHNEAGISEVLKQISATPHEKLHFVLGMVNDKDIATILNMLPKDAQYYFCKAKIPRALDASVLAEQAASAGLKGEICHSVPEALQAAKNNAKDNDLVFVGGSTFTVAEVV